MKSFSQYITESQLNESFSSEIVRDFIWPTIRSTNSWKAYYKWDKMTDEDFQKYDSVDEALKEARKRTALTTIFWFDTSNGGHRLTGITCGTEILLARLYSTYATKADLTASTPKLAAASSEAYKLVNPDKFKTSELRKARIEARDNALALKSAKEVHCENMIKYDAAKGTIGFNTKQDIIGWLNNAMETYNACMTLIQEQTKDIIQDPSLFDRWRAIRRKMDKLNNTVSEIMQYIVLLSQKKADIDSELEKPINNEFFIGMDARTAKQYADTIKKYYQDIQDELADMTEA